jgi:hypothetical protein
MREALWEVTTLLSHSRSLRFREYKAIFDPITIEILVNSFIFKTAAEGPI